MTADTFGVSLGSVQGWASGPGLSAFVMESNRIEGLTHGAQEHEVNAHIVLLSMKRITVADMEAFVQTIAGVPLRRERGQNVRVGPHRPPPGGPEIERELDAILTGAHRGASAFTTHVLYETLHPFMDGNGRSGRALWAWQTFREGRDPFALGFLHRWYYDSLEASRCGPIGLPPMITENVVIAVAAAIHDSYRPDEGDDLAVVWVDAVRTALQRTLWGSGPEPFETPSRGPCGGPT